MLLLKEGEITFGICQAWICISITDGVWFGALISAFQIPQLQNWVNANSIWVYHEH